MIEVINATQIPEQTPSEAVVGIAEDRASELRDNLEEAALDAEYTVEGHICEDVAFDVPQTARDDETGLIFMGYPEDSQAIVRKIEYNAPCDVLFASGFAD